MNDSPRLVPEIPSLPNPQGKDSISAYCNLCGHNGFSLVYKGNMDVENLDRFAQYSQYGDIFRCTRRIVVPVRNFFIVAAERPE